MQFLIKSILKFVQVLFHFVTESSSYTLSSVVHDMNKVGKWLLQEVVIQWEMIKPSDEKVVVVTYEGWSFSGGCSYCNVKGFHLHEMVACGGLTVFLMCIKFKFY